jgi:hypothetical protein
MTPGKFIDKHYLKEYEELDDIGGGGFGQAILVFSLIDH